MYVGEYGQKIVGKFVDNNGALVDITAAALSLVVVSPNGVGVAKTPTLLDGVSGEAEYVIEDGLLSSSGVYTFQFTADLGTALYRTPLIRLTVDQILVAA